MKKKFIFGVLVFLVVVLPVYGFAQSFSTSDLEGNWIGYDFTVAPSQVPPIFWLRGDATIDSSGNFTSATYTLPDGTTTISATSGSVALDANGVMSGSFTLETGDTVTVNHGKLDSGKTHAAYVSTATDGSMDLGVFFKSGGTFSQQNLQGIWHIYTTVIEPGEGVFWAYGTLSVDSVGNITTGSFTAADGAPVTVTSGALTLDSAGIIGGSFALDIGQTIPIAHGKLDQGKTIGAFVSVDALGFMSYSWIVKAGGTFADQDADDIWYQYAIGIDINTQQVFWLRGKYSVNDSGNMVGSYITPMGNVIRATSGSLSIDGSGVINGTLNLDTGDTATLPNGKLDQGKTSGCAVSLTDALPPMLTMSIVFKVDTIVPSFAGAANNALLANTTHSAALASAGYAMAGNPGWYSLMMSYALKAYEYAEDAHLEAFAAVDQDTTFWGTAAVAYCAFDLQNRASSLQYLSLAAQSETGGDLPSAQNYAGWGLIFGSSADLFNAAAIRCCSMEQALNP